VYRRFDIQNKSEEYDEVYNEGVGAPAHPFTDMVVLTRRDPLFAPEDNEPSTPMGIMEAGRLIYFFEYNFIPNIDDQIFEIVWADHRIKPKLSQIMKPYKEKYNIKEVNDHRADSGRIEYWTAHTNKDRVNY